MKKYFLIIILPLIFLRCNEASEGLNKWPEHLREEFLENCIDEQELLSKKHCECALNVLEFMKFDEGLSYQWIDQIPKETLLKILNECISSVKIDIMRNDK